MVVKFKNSNAGSLVNAFLLIIGICFSGYAQIEFKNNFKPISPINKFLPIDDSPHLSDEDLDMINSYVPENIPENKFIVPKNEIIDPEKAAARNQDLGVVKTDSGTAKVRYRDAAYVDGDRIRVFLNYVIIED